MKRLTENKIFWAITALVLSFVFWLYVTSVESDTIRQTFRGVRVELVGETVLRDSRSLVVTGLSTNTVSLEITGPRRVVAGLSAEDLSVQIDVSKLSQSAYASMQYTVSYPARTDTSGLTVTRKVPDTINFTVSRLNSKTIPVRGSFDGSIAPGYTAEPVSFEPSEITVSGPEAYLRNISYAWVSFSAMDVSTTYSIETGYTLMTAEDEPAGTDGITSSADVVKATLKILEMKELPLTVNLIYGAGANETNTIVTVTPETITLAGDSAVLSGMNNVPVATISLSDFNSTYTYDYPISFDNSLINVEGITEAEVKVEIVGLESKNFTVRNIQCRGVTEGYEAEVLSKALTVKIRGTPELLEKVSSDDLVAIADLSDYDVTTGSNIVNARIQVDGALDVGAIGGPYTIMVDIRKIS
jgi:YbbR domain-containing protein